MRKIFLVLLSTFLVFSIVGFGVSWLVVNSRFLCESCETDSLLSQFVKEEGQRRLPIEPVAESNFKDASDAKNEEKLVVLALDGVPFRVFEDLKKKGRFANFYDPSKMTATFPSLTKLSFSKILGSGLRDGYERVYFDQEKKSLHASYGIFEHLFVYKNTVESLSFLGSPGYIGYLLPKFFKNGVLAGLKKRILDSKKNHFFGYTSVSDFLSHGDGRRDLESFLFEVEVLLSELRRESKVPLKFLLFSDHGNSLKKGRRIDLLSRIKEAGMRPSKKLKKENDFLLPVNGLVGIATIHTRTSGKEKICESVLKEKGVDLCLYRQGENVFITNTEGAKSALSRSQIGFRYQSMVGDPLDYGLNTGEVKDLPEEEWWRTTKNLRYPDALHRIWQGFFDLVKNPAEVMVTMQDGFVVGPKLLSIPHSLIPSCGGTHGGLQDTQSDGFVAADFSETPSNLRAEWVYDLLKKATLGHEFEIPYEKKAKLELVDSTEPRSNTL